MLYIETQEGDTVRLKIKARDSLRAAIAADGETAVSELALQARNGIKVRFSVEGNLNAEELAAIRNVVEQASGLAEQFFAGNLPEAFAAAQSLDVDGAQLARVGLKLSVREHLTYKATGAFTLPPAPAPAVVPPEDAPVAVAPAPISTPEPVEATALADSASEPAPPGDTDVEPAPADAPSPAPPAPSLDAASQMLASIGTFLAHLLDSLAAGPIDADDSIDVSLRLRVFRSLVLDLSANPLPGTQSTRDESNGVPLLAATLAALAAQRSLDTHA